MSDSSGGTIAAVIFVLAFLSALGWYGWKVLGAQHYPMSRTVAAEDGSDMKVKIVGREGDSIYVVRISDGENLALDLGDFSEKDRDAILKLPEKAPAGGASVVATEEVPVKVEVKLSSKMARFVHLREAELAEIEKQRISLEERSEVLETLKDMDEELAVKDKLRIAKWKAAELRLEISKAKGLEEMEEQR